jgi:hypothetical protein
MADRTSRWSSDQTIELDDPQFTAMITPHPQKVQDETWAAITEAIREATGDGEAVRFSNLVLWDVAFDPGARGFGVGAAPNAPSPAGAMTARPRAYRPREFVLSPAAVFDAAAGEEDAEDVLRFAAGDRATVDANAEVLADDVDRGTAVFALRERDHALRGRRRSRGVRDRAVNLQPHGAVATQR